MKARDGRVAATICGFATAAVVAVAVAVPSVAQAASCPAASTTVVDGSPSYSYVRGCILSFDGTQIAYNLFEPLHPAKGSLYTVLEGPGWGNAGATSPDPLIITRGFAELTWDPRGMGVSGGYAELDAPSAEGRDVSELITKVLTGRPEIAVDRGGSGGQPRYENDSAKSNSYGEPVVGMVGASYGGGIQLAAASIDNRIKAIAPSATWNSLATALFPGAVPKLLWDTLLLGDGVLANAGGHLTGFVEGILGQGVGTGTPVSAPGAVDPSLISAALGAVAQGYASPSTLQLYGERSISAYGAGASGHVPRVPTLLYQGEADTLFNLDQVAANYAELKGADRHNPVKMILGCDGHTDCPSSEGYNDLSPASSPIWPGQTSAQAEENADLNWLDYYLRGRGRSDGMPATVVYQNQSGSFNGISAFPTPTAPGPAAYRSAKLAGTLTIDPLPSGLATSAGATGALLSDAPTSSSNAQLTVPVVTAPSGTQLPIVGVGHVTAKATSSTNANVFFRLLDKRSGDVIDMQTQALHLAPGAQRISLDLVGTGYDLPAGDTLELQVSSSTNSLMPNLDVGTVTFSGGEVEVPVLRASTATACRAARGSLTRTGIARISLGTRGRRLPAATAHTGRSYRYCVAGGRGKTIAAVLGSNKRVEFVATNAHGYATGGRSRWPGERAAALLRRATRVGRGLWLGGRLRGGSRYVYGVAGGRIRFVGVAARSLALHPRQLRAAVRASGFG